MHLHNSVRFGCFSSTVCRMRADLNEIFSFDVTEETLEKGQV